MFVFNNISFNRSLSSPQTAYVCIFFLLIDNNHNTVIGMETEYTYCLLDSISKSIYITCMTWTIVISLLVRSAVDVVVAVPIPSAWENDLTRCSNLLRVFCNWIENNTERKRTREREKGENHVKYQWKWNKTVHISVVEYQKSTGKICVLSHRSLLWMQTNHSLTYEAFHTHTGWAKNGYIVGIHHLYNPCTIHIQIVRKPQISIANELNCDEICLNSVLCAVSQVDSTLKLILYSNWWQPIW